MNRLGLGLNLGLTSSGFDPGAFSANGVLWLDMSRPDSLTLNGSNISAINNLYGGTDATQGTAPLRPVYDDDGLNGKPTALFTAANTEYMTLTGLSSSSGELTMAIAFEPVTVSGTTRHMFDSASGRATLSHDTSNGAFSFLTNGGVLNAGAVGAGTFAVMVATAKAGAQAVYRDASPTAAETATAAGGMNIGGGTILGAFNSGLASYYDGKISEVIILDRALGALDVSRLGNYLVQKWS